MPDEVWLDTKYPGYKVSSLGRVVGRRGTILAASVNDRGYRNITVYGGNSRTVNLHVLICETFHGPAPEGMEARHLDGNSLNNRSDNLAWGTRAVNSWERDEHIRQRGNQR